jgi:type II secretory pathway pseudopilin PulG
MVMTKPDRPCAARVIRLITAFTLVEVLLAVSISIGLLAVALYFYQQAAEFRAQVITEAERVSTARLIMDRITSELRTARRHGFYEQAFIGEPDFLQFIKTDVPSRMAWSGGELGRSAAAETDLKLVRYSVAMSPGTNQSIAGITRTEEPLVEYKEVIENSASVSLTPANSSAPLLTESFRYLRFRYWDGAEWVASWSKPALPRGVEITLGSEPAPSEALNPVAPAPVASAFPDVPRSEDYPFEVFQRIVYLPGSSTEGVPLVFSGISTNTPLR